MKNIYRSLIILCFLITTGVVSGQKSPSTLLLDSVYTYNWASNNWSLNIKEYCTKNGSGQPIQDLFKKYNSGSSQFLDYARILFGYSDTITVPTLITDQFLYSSNWNTYQHYHYLARNIPDTTYFKTWNNLRHDFTYGIMNTYQYNDSLLPLVSMVLGLDTATQNWYDISKTTNTYTGLNQPLEQILYSWQNSNSTWINVLKFDNVYDTNNLLVNSIEYTWNDLTSNWVNSIRTTYYYNPTSLPNLMVKESYDTTLQVWDSVQQTFYIYNQLNWLMTFRSQSYLQSNGTWFNSGLTFYTYSPSGDQNSMTEDVWDTIHSTYITIAYQNVDSATRKLAESYTRTVDPQTFLIVNGSRNLYTYGSAGDSLNWVSQSWDVSGLAWDNQSQVNYTYDSTDNLLSEKVSQNWVTSSSSWLNSAKSDYYYSASSGIGEKPAIGKPCIYANPMVTGNPVYCPDFKTGDKYTLRVCSLTGIDVYRTTFIGGEAVTISRSLIPGLYFLIIEENGNVLYKDKVIIIQ
jgi:hypothetical protein